MTELEDNTIVETLDDELQHHGVKGQRWGVSTRGKMSNPKRTVRSIKKTVGSIKSKIKKIQAKAGKKKVQMEALKAKKQEAKAALSKKTKSPKDMNDSELKDYHAKITTERKLGALTKNKSLDRFSQEEAKKILRTKDSMSPDDLKKETTRLETRATQLKELRPSSSGKPGLVYTIAKGALKNLVDTDKVIDVALSKTVFKGQIDNLKKVADVANAVSKASNAAKGTAIADVAPTKRKVSYMETSIKKVIKTGKNAQIDKAIDKIWAYKVDRRAGF